MQNEYKWAYKQCYALTRYLDKNQEDYEEFHRLFTEFSVDIRFKALRSFLESKQRFTGWMNETRRWTFDEMTIPY